jgi:hypothetical protein
MRLRRRSVKRPGRVIQYGSRNRHIEQDRIEANELDYYRNPQYSTQLIFAEVPEGASRT